MSWEEKEEVKKGNIGERLVWEYISSLGLIPFKPVFDGAHPFDMVIARYGNINSLVIAEIKTKKRKFKREEIGGKYSYVTGFNTKSLNTYLNFMQKYGIKVHIYFVDELEKMIYGNKLSVLIKNTMQEGEVTLFRLCDMIKISTLTDEQAEEIEKHTKKSKFVYFPVGEDALGLISRGNQNESKN